MSDKTEWSGYMSLMEMKRCYQCLNEFVASNQQDVAIAGVCCREHFNKLYVDNLTPPYLERIKNRMDEIKCPQ